MTPPDRLTCLDGLSLRNLEAPLGGFSYQRYECPFSFGPDIRMQIHDMMTAYLLEAGYTQTGTRTFGKEVCETHTNQDRRIDIYRHRTDDRLLLDRVEYHLRTYS